MTQSAPPDAIPVTPVVITGAPDPSREVSVIDVTVSAFTLTGYIIGGALIAGLLAGLLLARFRQGRAITRVIEERGGNHNFLRE